MYLKGSCFVLLRINSFADAKVQVRWFDIGRRWKLKPYSLSPPTVTHQLLGFWVWLWKETAALAVNTELWSGMLLVSEHASSFSCERPLKDDGMLTTPPCATMAPLFRLPPGVLAGGTVCSIKLFGGFKNLSLLAERLFPNQHIPCFAPSVGSS